MSILESATEMEQHVQFGSFTSPPVARRGARRSPAAWLSVLPRQPGRPSNNRPDCRVVPAGVLHPIVIPIHSLQSNIFSTPPADLRNCTGKTQGYLFE